MDDFIELVAGNIHWKVRRDAAELAFATSAVLGEWLRHGKAKRVKHGPHRAVYKLHTASGNYYLKHFRVPDARAALSQWLQRSKGLREWKMLRSAEANRVSTPSPVAIGEERRAGFVLNNYLITEDLDQVVALPDFAFRILPSFDPAQQTRIRRQLTEGTVRLLVQAHRAGIQHQDLHAANLVVRLSPEAQVFLIDLDAARKRTELSWRRAINDLTLLGVSTLRFASRTDRLRFLRRYLELRPELGQDLETAAHKLTRRVNRVARFGRWKRTGQCLRDNRRFYHEDIGTAHGFAVREFDRALMLALLRDPNEPLENSSKLLKSSISSAVAEMTIPLRGQPVAVIYKRFECAKLLDPVRALFHRSPALRAWIAGYSFLLRGIATPRPIAVVETTPRALVRENYLFTERIPGAVTLARFFQTEFQLLADRERRRQLRSLVVQLARLVRKMHDNAISHRDMKMTNILLAPGSQLYLIDLDAVHIWRKLPEVRRIQNLARIFVSAESARLTTRTDYARFLRSYCPTALHTSSWKEIWRQVASKAKSKIVQNRQRGRKVT